MSTLPLRSNGPTEDAAYLVVDCESVPDGRLISLVKYPDETLTAERAIERAQEEAVEKSWNNSDFLPVTLQIPVAICVVRVAADYSLRRVTCLDAPKFRTREMVGLFWEGVFKRPQAKLVTFNGRGFDMPLLELAAFRYALAMPQYYQNRNRYRGDIDLMDWFTNYGAYRFPGGLNLLAKLMGMPGKTGVDGGKVYEMYRAGRLREINDYCLGDTLDTYFVFLRTRVMTGDITREREGELVGLAKDFLARQVPENPAFGQYLANWRDATPWP